MTAVITLTGGVDSTLMMYKHLTETTEPIVAFRVDFQNVPPPHRVAVSAAEEIAAERVVEWLKANTRDFEYRVETIDTIPEGEWITLHATRIGAQLVEQGLGDYLAVGRNKEGFSKTKGAITRAAQFRIYSETTSKGELRHPLEHISKIDAYDLLPPELLALTVQCNRPKIEDGEIVNCGECTTGCMYHALIRDKRAKGFSNDAIFDYVLRLQREGPYEGLPVTDWRWICKDHASVDFPELHTMPKRTLR